TWLQNSKRPLLRIASDRIKDNIHAGHRLLESLRSIVHDRFSAQTSDVVQISGAGGRDDMKAGLRGQLYGVRADVARSAMDEDGLPGDDVGILEQHLPSCDRDNRSRCCLDEAQGLWFWRHHSGRRQRIFRVCPIELLVRGPVDFVAESESRYVRSDTFDDPRELGTENQRQGLEFHLALTDESIPIADPRRLDADQQLPSAGF